MRDLSEQPRIKVKSLKRLANKYSQANANRVSSRIGDDVPSPSEAVDGIIAFLQSFIEEAVRKALNEVNNEDRFLDADEAAALLGVSKDWVYRHASKLPFTRRLGRKMVRFSQKELLSWAASRRLS
jgi:excisionase family DNA binding protein